MEVITHIDAQLKGWRFYYTGKPCKYGHLDKRYASDGRCVGCSLAISRLQREGGYERPVYNAISCTLSNGQREWIASRARELGCNLTDFIRLLIEDDRFKHGK